LPRHTLAVLVHRQAIVSNNLRADRQRIAAQADPAEVKPVPGTVVRDWHDARRRRARRTADGDVAQRERSILNRLAELDLQDLEGMPGAAGGNQPGNVQVARQQGSLFEPL